MRAVIDPRTERVLTEAGAGIARVLDARRRHAVVLAVDVVWYIVAALPPDGSVTFGDVVRLLRWFARGFSEGVEVDDGDE
jgi:hypothetical protein